MEEDNEEEGGKEMKIRGVGEDDEKEEEEERRRR